MDYSKGLIVFLMVFLISFIPSSVEAKTVKYVYNPLLYSTEVYGGEYADGKLIFSDGQGYYGNRSMSAVVMTLAGDNNFFFEFRAEPKPYFSYGKYIVNITVGGLEFSVINDADAGVIIAINNETAICYYPLYYRTKNMDVSFKLIDREIYVFIKGDIAGIDEKIKLTQDNLNMMRSGRTKDYILSVYLNSRDADSVEITNLYFGIERKESPSILLIVSLISGLVITSVLMMTRRDRLVSTSYILAFMLFLIVLSILDIEGAIVGYIGIVGVVGIGMFHQYFVDRFVGEKGETNFLIIAIMLVISTVLMIIQGSLAETIAEEQFTLVYVSGMYPDNYVLYDLSQSQWAYVILFVSAIMLSIPNGYLKLMSYPLIVLGSMLIFYYTIPRLAVAVLIGIMNAMMVFLIDWRYIGIDEETRKYLLMVLFGEAVITGFVLYFSV